VGVASIIIYCQENSAEAWARRRGDRGEWLWDGSKALIGSIDIFDRRRRSLRRILPVPICNPRAYDAGVVHAMMVKPEIKRVRI
jgi:hypothetical protein